MTTTFKCKSRGYRGVQPTPLRNTSNGKQMVYLSANETTRQEMSKAQIPTPSNDSAPQPLPIHLHVLDIPRFDSRATTDTVFRSSHNLHIIQGPNFIRQT